MDDGTLHTTAASEVAAKVDIGRILYAQCWEDADILLEGLDVRAGDVCVSVASAGDNSLSLLTRDPARVIAVDLSPAQLNCLDFRVAAYRALTHGELLELMGSRRSDRRRSLYAACRPHLRSEASRAFWDDRIDRIDAFGLGGIGRFERYLRLFRRLVLPLIHSAAEVEALLDPKPEADRAAFYDACWDNWRWRTVIRGFFSQTLMAWLGRSPAFFAYVEGSVADHVLRRARHAATALDPSANPYLHWILTGHHGRALPHALRAENFEAIRDRLDRLEWHEGTIEALAEGMRIAGGRADRFNLSDIFEYMSEESYRDVLIRFVDVANPGARLLYWNMMVPRTLPDPLRRRVRSLDRMAADLHARDKAFFYRAVNVEEVL